MNITLRLTMDIISLRLELDRPDPVNPATLGRQTLPPGERVPNDPSSSLLLTRIRIGITELKCKLESRSILEKEANVFHFLLLYN